MMLKQKSTQIVKFKPLLIPSLGICLLLIFAFSVPENNRHLNYLVADRAAVLDSQYGEDTIDTEVFFIVEDMPEFQGKGFEAFRSWIAKNIVYPPKAESDSISGKVYVQFIINSEGNIDDVVIVRGIHPLLDAEAKRVIESSPAWTPGKQSGKKVKVVFTCPVNFVLD